MIVFKNQLEDLLDTNSASYLLKFFNILILFICSLFFNKTMNNKNDNMIHIIRTDGKDP